MSQNVITQVYKSAALRQVVLRYLDPTTGLAIPTLPQVRLTLTDLQYAALASGQTQIEAYLRRVHFTNSADGSKKRCYGLFTFPEDDSSDDGHSSGTQDLYLGGGSGGVTMMSVVSYNQSAANGDYLVCHPQTGANVNVAVEPQLQSGLGYQASGTYAGLYVQTMPDTNIWSYTGCSAGALSRVSTCIAGPRSGTVLTEFITPPFLVGDVVPVWGCANTGVTVGGVAAAYIALTGRQWAAGT